MDFERSYNVHCSLRLKSGRKIILKKLAQSLTYAGLLEGSPVKGLNDRSIQAALERARQDDSSSGEPYLVEPERRDYLREPGDMQSIFERRKFREGSLLTPEWLPLVECIGVFDALEPARDRAKDGSSLIVLWYQDDFGLDTAPMGRLQLIDWDRHATDWQY